MIPELVVVLGSVLLATSALGSTTPRVTWNNEQLEVIAEETPLWRILELCARETGLQVQGIEAATEVVSINFSGLSLREGLKRLLGHRSYVLVEDPWAEGESIPLLILLGGSGRSMATVPARPPVTAAARSNVGPLDTERRDDAAASLRDPEAPMRRWAIRMLRQGAEAQAFLGLVAGLTDVDPGVREEALAGLGQHGQAALEPVKAMLQVEKDARVRAAALQVLGQVGREAVADVLRGALADVDPHVRIAAVEALGFAGGAIAAQGLADGAGDREPAVRMAALRTLAFYLRDDTARRVLERSLSDQDTAVRGLAGDLLEHLGAAKARER